MTLARIEAVLREAIGLDAATIGPGGLEQAVRRRMATCAVGGAEDYLVRLTLDASELQALIESVVVPETWFFRDPPAFHALTHFVRTRLRERPGDPVRLLSLPCATGEEPYSMAMALLDARLPLKTVSIHAMDVSECALAQARVALYGRNAFRGADLSFRERHFEASAGGWQLSDAAQQAVRFYQANILDAAISAGSERYDIVFCRNLLIYFDTRAQEAAIDGLARLMAPGAILCVGASEAHLLRRHGFSAAGAANAFAFQRRAQATTAAPPRPFKRPVVTMPPPVPPVGAPASANDNDQVEAIRQAADEGRQDEAAARALDHMRRHGPSAALYCLLGLIQEARSESEEAAALYRKALYLDPAHREALLHLALLSERCGDTENARALQSRLSRLQQASL